MLVLASWQRHNDSRTLPMALFQKGETVSVSYKKMAYRKGEKV